MGKLWKKILFVILIIACLFDVVRIIARKNSLSEEIQATLNYFQHQPSTVQQQTK